MKLRNLFLIHSLVALLYALCLLVIPKTVLFLYGFGVTPGEILLAQFFGTELLVAGLITLLARDADASTTRNAITISIMISSAIGAVVSIGGTLGGTMDALGWTAVALFGFFAIAFAYFQFLGPEE
jgi:hypothetical protein